MNDGQGMLVSRDWLTKVDKTLFHTEEETPSKDARRASLYYDVRPAQLASAWTYSGGVWMATAYFMSPSGVETTAYNVYSPTSTSDPGGTVGTTRFMIIWRGRWEVLGGVGRDIDSLTEQKTVVKTVAAQTTTASVSIDASASAYLKTASLSSLENTEEGTIPYVASVACVDGDFVVTTKYLKLTTTTETHAHTGGVSPSTLVSGITHTTQTGVLVRKNV